MILKACMPVNMNSGKIVAGQVDGDLKVLQEVLADLKRQRFAICEIKLKNTAFNCSLVELVFNKCCSSFYEESLTLIFASCWWFGSSMKRLCFPATTCTCDTV